MSEEDDTRREYMWERYGRPVTVDAATALRMLGITDVDPSEVHAFRYRDREAADAYASANLEHYGHPTLGSYILGDEVIGVLDFRPAIADMRRRYVEEVARTQ
jgi:hypothetical protein